jgi:hypothetical protein
VREDNRGTLRTPGILMALKILRKSSNSLMYWLVVSEIEYVVEKKEREWPGRTSESCAGWSRAWPRVEVG